MLAMSYALYARPAAFGRTTTSDGSVGTGTKKFCNQEHRDQSHRVGIDGARTHRLRAAASAWHPSDSNWPDDVDFHLAHSTQGGAVSTHEINVGG